MYPVGDRVRKLAEALSDSQISVVWNAARDLARLGPAANPALPQLRAASEASDPTSVLWATYAIARITGAEPASIPFFVAALNDARIFPGMAATVLAALGPLAIDAVRPLAAQLASPISDNRWSAAAALARIGPGAATAVPQLAAALKDTDEKVRWYAAHALAEIGEGAAEAVPELIACLEDPDEDVRGYSAIALGQIASPAATAALAELLDDLNGNVRASALSALQKIQSATNE